MLRTYNILYYTLVKEGNMNQWQNHHFLDELPNENINIHVFNALKYENALTANIQLIELVKKSKIKFDVFLTGLDGSYFNPDIFKELNNFGLKTLLICYDNLHVPFVHKKIAPFFDLVWLTSFETENLFKKWGAKTIVLPYAANPYFFKPSMTPELNTVGFIGSPYGTRMKKIEQLISHQIPVSIYSSAFFNNFAPAITSKRTFIQKAKHTSELIRFPIGRKILYAELLNQTESKKTDTEIIRSNKYIHLLESVTFDKMVELYSSFALSIGIIDIRNTYLLKKPVLKLHLRTFEIPMSGGLQIVNYTNELASYFEDGKEIILYRTEEELVDKAKFYLNDFQRQTRDKMKIAARKRAEADHTWQKRFSAVFNALNI